MEGKERFMKRATIRPSTALTDTTQYLRRDLYDIAFDIEIVEQ